MTDSSSGSPVIRPMVSSDLERIAEIDTRVLGKPRPEYWEMKLEQVEKSNQVSSLVAEMDGRVVGFIIGDVSRWEYGVPEDIGYIDTIGVDPAYQRKGVARILFREMTASLREQGVKSIYTFVTKRDYRLLKFFNHLGFQPGDMVNLELDI